VIDGLMRRYGRRWRRVVADWVGAEADGGRVYDPGFSDARNPGS